MSHSTRRWNHRPTATPLGHGSGPLADCLERPARTGGYRTLAEEASAAVSGRGGQGKPGVTLDVTEVLQHRGRGRQEGRLLARRREAGRGAEPDQRELSEPDRLVIARVDSLDVGLQLADRGRGREVPAVPVQG